MGCQSTDPDLGIAQAGDLLIDTKLGTASKIVHRFLGKQTCESWTGALSRPCRVCVLSSSSGGVGVDGGMSADDRSEREGCMCMWLCGPEFLELRLSHIARHAHQRSRCGSGSSFAARMSQYGC